MLRLVTAALACASLLFAVDSEDHVRKSTPVSSATRLVLNADVGSIRVQPGPGNTVEVDVTFRGDAPSPAEHDRMRRDFTLDLKQEGSEVRVTGAFHKGWVPIFDFLPFIFGGQTICHDWRCLEYGRWMREVEYRVTVPEKFSADIDTWTGSVSVSNLRGEVNAHSSGGPLNFDGIGGPVNGRTSGGGITLVGGKSRAVVHTSGGPIEIKEVAGDVEASTSGGGISIEGNMGRVRAHTSGGPIRIRGASGAIDATTSGGGVSASLVGQPKEECRLSTSGGSIDVTLRHDVRVDLDASSSGGPVWTDFAVPHRDDERHSHELHASINGGGPRLYLHTSGGGISVHRAD
jgi:Putative adhesin